MGVPDSQELHKRARESASELRKLTTGLSAGGVAALFVVLTRGDIQPPLTNVQRFLAAAAVACFGMGVLAGMLAWHADAERWFYGAKEAESDDQVSKAAFKSNREWWKNRTWRLSQALRYLFLAGVVLAVSYTLARLLGWNC
jgi:hypothetical protein